MAKRDKEKELREQYPDLDNLLVKLLNQGGQAFAAFQLGTTQPTIGRIMKGARIEKVTTYIKQEAARS